MQTTAVKKALEFLLKEIHAFALDYPANIAKASELIEKHQGGTPESVSEFNQFYREMIIKYKLGEFVRILKPQDFVFELNCERIELQTYDQVDKVYKILKDEVVTLVEAIDEIISRSNELLERLENDTDVKQLTSDSNEFLDNIVQKSKLTEFVNIGVKEPKISFVSINGGQDPGTNAMRMASSSFRRIDYRPLPNEQPIFGGRDSLVRPEPRVTDVLSQSETQDAGKHQLKTNKNYWIFLSIPEFYEDFPAIDPFLWQVEKLGRYLERRAEVTIPLKGTYFRTYQEILELRWPNELYDDLKGYDDIFLLVLNCPFEYFNPWTKQFVIMKFPEPESNLVNYCEVIKQLGKEIKRGNDVFEWHRKRTQPFFLKNKGRVVKRLIDAIELKPGLFGFTIDLKKLWP